MHLPRTGVNKLRCEVTSGFAPKVASDPKAPFLNLKSSRCKMCLHSWGRLLAIFPPHHLRVGGPLGHLTRPVLSYKEEGACCGPLHGFAVVAVVNCW